MSTPLSGKTLADGNSPDPEELETGTEEEVDIPLPEKVSHDFDATGNEPDDQEIIQEWKSQDDKANADDNNEAEPDDDKEDLTQGDEGVDDPSATD